jgi:hypothetical protein
VTAHVLAPSGVTNASFVHTAPTALAYVFPSTGRSGWSSGDLATVSGGAGWHMSVHDVLNVMGTFRRGGSIMSPAKAQQLLDNMFGIDQVINATDSAGHPIGKLYNKNGSWGDGAGDIEQCVAYYMPDDVEVAVFVNSSIAASPATAGGSLRGLVRAAYVNSVH